MREEGDRKWKPIRRCKPINAKVTGGMILHTVPKKILNIRTKNVPVTAGADATVYVHGFGLYIAHNSYVHLCI